MTFVRGLRWQQKWKEDLGSLKGREFWVSTKTFCNWSLFNVPSFLQFLHSFCTHNSILRRWNSYLSWENLERKTFFQEVEIWLVNLSLILQFRFVDKKGKLSLRGTMRQSSMVQNKFLNWLHFLRNHWCTHVTQIKVLDRIQMRFWVSVSRVSNEIYFSLPFCLLSLGLLT